MSGALHPSSLVLPVAPVASEDDETRSELRVAVRILNDLVVHSSVWVAGSIASLSVFSAHVMGIDAPAAAHGMVFASALFVYNLDHVVDARVQASSDPDARRCAGSTALLVLVAAAALAMIALVGAAPPRARWVFLAYVSPAVLYGLPVIPWARGGALVFRRLKEVAGGKGWLVASVITLATVGLPWAWVGGIPSAATPHLAAFVFIYVASNTHMFDVRDLASDRAHGVSTLPTLLGVGGAKRLLVLLNVLVAGVLLAGVGSPVWTHPEFGVGVALTIAYVVLISPRTPNWVYGFLVDGAWYVPAVLAAMCAHPG